AVELPELSPTDGCLDFGQAPVGAQACVKPAKPRTVFRGLDPVPILAVIFVRPSSLPQGLVVGGQHPAFSGGRHDLVLAEGEGGDIGEATDATTSMCGAVGLSAVLDQRDAVVVAQVHDGIHVARPASEM